MVLISYPHCFHLAAAMAFGIGRGLATPLLVINFILYLIAACLAGWALNRNFDAARGTGEGGVGTSKTLYIYPLFDIAFNFS